MHIRWDRPGAFWNFRSWLFHSWLEYDQRRFRIMGFEVEP